jgi:hypothetical protein
MSNARMSRLDDWCGVVWCDEIRWGTHHHSTTSPNQTTTRQQGNERYTRLRARECDLDLPLHRRARHERPLCVVPYRVVFIVLWGCME